MTPSPESIAGRPSRRGFLQAAGAAALAAAAVPSLAHAEALAGREPVDPPEVPNETVAKLLQDKFGGRVPKTGKVQLDMPAVAEDGRVVPVLIESELPMTPERYVKAVHLIVDHNPDAGLATFHLTPAIGSVNLSTRIKMKRTTWVRCICETNDGELWASYAKVNVTLNGCG